MSNVQPNTILEHYRSLTTTKQGIGDAGRRHQNAVKKSNKDGVNTPMLLQAIAYVKADPEVSKINLRDFLHYLKVLQADTGSAQLAMDFTLPDDDARALQENWNAEQDGIEQGRTGAVRESNPHSPGTEVYTAWDNGWIVGHQKLEDGLGPKKRGRPPKADEQTEGQTTELRKEGPEPDDIDYNAAVEPPPTAKKTPVKGKNGRFEKRA